MIAWTKQQNITKFDHSDACEQGFLCFRFVSSVAKETIEADTKLETFVCTGINLHVLRIAGQAGLWWRYYRVRIIRLFVYHDLILCANISHDECFINE